MQAAGTDSPRRRHGRPREVVVITGASAGLGRAIAEAFAGDGARIGLIARDGVRLAAVSRAVLEAGGEALPLALDVADAAAVERAADTVERTFGPIDIWINNAMVSVFAPVHEITPEEFRRVTEVTYLGYVHGTLAALRRMRPRNRGTIVQVGSALAYRGIPLQSAYCAAKHAIEGFCDSLRAELRHDRSRVHVTMVHMPALNTPQFEWSRSRMPHRSQPVPPIYDPAIGADAVRFAAHARRREVWVGASTVWAIAGNRLAPWLGDWYLARTGYDAQQTDEPDAPGRCDNLYSPCPGPYGVRGRFGARTRRFSLQLWLTKRRELAAAGALVIAGLAWARTLGGSAGSSRAVRRAATP
jgi:NAD(P)-dependent dehydrogenase (short-subunit alcohol dehydrogenase family)